MTSRCPIRRKFRFITTVMLALPFWLFCYIQQAHSWAIQTTGTMQPKSFVRMDTEGPPVPFAAAWKRPVAFGAGNRHRQKQKRSASSSSSPSPSAAASLKHGMPWKSSIDTRKPSDCLFMPFWEWQVDHFERHLSNFTIDKDHYVASDKKDVRMVTFSASSDEYRLIRMTYLDAGNQTQIFTSVAYPRGNLPILGCDFLSFQGGKRTLAIVDFQPLHEHERQHDATYEHLLRPIRQAYKSLQEPMSDRFFDPSQFFSSQTLLGRFGMGDQPRLQSELLPAWQAYVQTHIGMAKQHHGIVANMNSATKDAAASAAAAVVESHHAAYDTYCLDRDPAHPMFTSLFGPDFADDFLYNTMFPLAKRPVGGNDE